MLLPLHSPVLTKELTDVVLFAAVACRCPPRCPIIAVMGHASLFRRPIAEASLLPGWPPPTRSACAGHLAASAQRETLRRRLPWATGPDSGPAMRGRRLRPPPRFFSPRRPSPRTWPPWRKPLACGDPQGDAAPQRQARALGLAELCGRSGRPIQPAAHGPSSPVPARESRRKGPRRRGLADIARVQRAPCSMPERCGSSEAAALAWGDVDRRGAGGGVFSGHSAGAWDWPPSSAAPAPPPTRSPRPAAGSPPAW